MQITLPFLCTGFMYLFGLLCPAFSPSVTLQRVNPHSDDSTPHSSQLLEGLFSVAFLVSDSLHCPNQIPLPAVAAHELIFMEYGFSHKK